MTRPTPPAAPLPPAADSTGADMSTVAPVHHENEEWRDFLRDKLNLPDRFRAADGDIGEL